MKDNNLDSLLQAALKAEYTPSKELNEKLILSAEEAERGEASLPVIKKTSRALVRVAAAFVLIVTVGSVGVYAANKLLKKPVVTRHGMSVGNEDYISDEAFTEPLDPVTEETLGLEEGGPNDKWLTKEVILTGGTYQNTHYTYPDYETAVADTRLPNLFSGSIGNAESVSYVETIELENGQPKDGGYKEYELDCHFQVNSGSADVMQSCAEGVAEDAAYGISINNTCNERSYTAGTGLEFTLVDETGTGGPVKTYVMIVYGSYTDYIIFQDLSEEQMYRILDQVRIQESAEAAEAEEAAKTTETAEAEETAETTETAEVEETESRFLNQEKELVVELDTYLHSTDFTEDNANTQVSYDAFDGAVLEEAIVDYKQNTGEENAAREYTLKYKLESGKFLYLKGYGTKEADDKPISGVQIREISEEDYALANSWITYSEEHTGDDDYNWRDTGNGIFKRDLPTEESDAQELMYKITL